jgi:hypothetical protein
MLPRSDALQQLLLLVCCADNCEHTYVKAIVLI